MVDKIYPVADEEKAASIVLNNVINNVVKNDEDGQLLADAVFKKMFTVNKWFTDDEILVVCSILGKHGLIVNNLSTAAKTWV